MIQQLLDAGRFSEVCRQYKRLRKSGGEPLLDWLEHWRRVNLPRLPKLDRIEGQTCKRLPCVEMANAYILSETGIFALEEAFVESLPSLKEIEKRAAEVRRTWTAETREERRLKLRASYDQRAMAKDS